MKRLDELSWKIAKKKFFDTRRPSWRPKWLLKWLKIGFVARNFSGKSFNQILFLLWILFGWKVFKSVTRSFFSNFNPQFFLQGRIRTNVDFSWFLAIILQLRFFFRCYIKKLGKSSVSRSAKFCCDRFGVSYMSVP